MKAWENLGTIDFTAVDKRVGEDIRSRSIVSLVLVAASVFREVHLEVAAVAVACFLFVDDGLVHGP